MATKERPSAVLREFFAELLDKAIAAKFPGVIAKTEYSIGAMRLVTHFEPEIRGKKKVAEVAAFTETYMNALGDARDFLAARERRRG